MSEDRERHVTGLDRWTGAALSSTDSRQPRAPTFAAVRGDQLPVGAGCVAQRVSQLRGSDC